MQLDPIQLMVATFIAGAIAGPAAQLIKNQLKLEGDPALYLALGISLITGFFAAVVSGAPIPLPQSDPLAFVAAIGSFAGMTFAFATFIYKRILEKLERGVFANLKKSQLP